MISITKLLTIFSFWFEFFHILESYCQSHMCNNEILRSLGYVRVGEIDKCLLFSAAVLSWHKASQTCSLLGGRLYTAHHVSELLQEYLIPYNFRHQDYWIGLNDIHSEGDFRWNLQPNGDEKLGVRSVELLPWQEGQPDNLGNEEDCVMKGRDGTWRDESCDMKLHYICEAIVSRQDLDPILLKSKDAPPEEKNRRYWIAVVLGLFCFLFVITSIIHAITKTRLNKRKGRSEEEEKDDISFTSAIASDQDVSSSYASTYASSSVETIADTSLKSTISKTSQAQTNTTPVTGTETAEVTLDQEEDRTVESPEAQPRVSGSSSLTDDENS